MACDELFRLYKFQNIDHNDQKTKLWNNSNIGQRFKDNILSGLEAGKIKVPKNIPNKLFGITDNKIKQNNLTKIESDNIKELILSIYCFRGGINVNDISNNLHIELSGLLWPILKQYNIPSTVSEALDLGEKINNEHNLGQDLSGILSWYYNQQTFITLLQKLYSKRVELYKQNIKSESG